jgi:hypothetical protein
MDRHKVDGWDTDEGGSCVFLNDARRISGLVAGDGPIRAQRADAEGRAS